MKTRSGILVVAGVVWLATPAYAQDNQVQNTVESIARSLVTMVLDLLPKTVDPDGPSVDPVPATGCDPLDPTRCLLPFPNDFFTVADETTDSGRRVSFSIQAMPRNAAGKPIEPFEWNRNDGFSPGSMILTYVPGLHLDETQAPRITDPADSIERNTAGDAVSPIVVVNAGTLELHPVFAELDENRGGRITIGDAVDLVDDEDNVPEPLRPVTILTPPTQDHERLLILRPLVNFDESTRYLVALRRLRNTSGVEIPPNPAFVALRDGYLAWKSVPDAPLPPLTRAAHFFTNVFPALEAAGVAIADLYLAWDFTVASERNLSERALHVRNEGFKELNATDPNITYPGNAPVVSSITATENPNGASNPHTARRVTGTFRVPNFLDGAGGAPGSRLNYVGSVDGNLPARHPSGDFVEANFICNIPRSVLDVTTNPASPQVSTTGLPTLYGHGLLGSAGENNSSHARRMAHEGVLSMCATDWDGMSGEDLVTIATILADVSNFPKLADRSQQGFLNFMFLGRLMLHPEGFCTKPEFQDVDGDCVFDHSTDHVVYDGNSQGAIMGGSLVALAHDVRRGVLGVPGMNYSTLLNRSVDWENAYAVPFYIAYPDKMDQQLAFALMQMLWDRAESNGYAHHMTRNPYPDPSPAEDPFHAAKTDPSAFGDKQILLHVAYADHQVTPLAAEVEARTIGAGIIKTSLYLPTHWETTPYFGFTGFEPGDLPTMAADRKSALVYWHNGNNPAPNGNVPPLEECRDPHESPRRDPRAVAQKAAFLHDGVIDDVCGGLQCQTGFRRTCENGNQPGATTNNGPFP